MADDTQPPSNIGRHQVIYNSIETNDPRVSEPNVSQPQDYNSTYHEPNSYNDLTSGDPDMDTAIGNIQSRARLHPSNPDLVSNLALALASSRLDDPVDISADEEEMEVVRPAKLRFADFLYDFVKDRSEVEIRLFLGYVSNVIVEYEDLLDGGVHYESEDESCSNEVTKAGSETVENIRRIGLGLDNVKTGNCEENMESLDCEIVWQ